jgi:undecaprenyl-diphosphatase
MNLFQITILAIVQGLAELLPVSSSAHVIVTEKLLGLDPTTPAMTLLLVMLHTGTMFAVIIYFRSSWRKTYFSSMLAFRTNALYVVVATLATGAVGLILVQLIKFAVAGNVADFEIEKLFGNSKLMATALAAAGLVIIMSSSRRESDAGDLSIRIATLIGAVQGLCLPFRGFSRSGATISTGMAMGVTRRRAEEFSFALAVVLTPAVVVKEAYRFYKMQVVTNTGADNLLPLFMPSLVGMVFSFLAGLVALRWLSRWLEQGHWNLFGWYCLVAAIVVLWVG